MQAQKLQIQPILSLIELYGLSETFCYQVYLANIDEHGERRQEIATCLGDLRGTCRIVMLYNTYG